MDDLSPHELVLIFKREGVALRAGRLLLGWDAERMAEAANISLLRLVANEQGHTNGCHSKMRDILQSRGVKFGDDGSVLGLSNDTMTKEEAGNDG